MKSNKKIAIVTGASSGMGRETAIQLADRFGGKLDEIWVVARRKERMEELIGHVPVALRIFPMDITDRIQLERLRMALEAERPKVVFLVNAAGFGKIGRVGSLPLADETGMIQLNCQALCMVTHLVSGKDGKGIHVTAVCPGPVKTEFFDIAETTGSIPLYKRLVMADPVKVVDRAIRDSLMGKSLSIYGPLMQAFALLAKAIPHSWILPFFR